jgi:hypothetical protein
MVRPDREALKETVEVDETYVGGPEAGLKGGRQLVDKALIVGAVEVRGTAAGRVRLHEPGIRSVGAPRPNEAQSGPRPS